MLAVTSVNSPSICKTTGLVSYYWHKVKFPQWSEGKELTGVKVMEKEEIINLSVKYCFVIWLKKLIFIAMMLNLNSGISASFVAPSYIIWQPLVQYF